VQVRVSKYDLNAVHTYNKFLWSRLKEEFGYSENDYKGLVPIIPTQQVQVFNDLPSSHPFIVYTYMDAGYDLEFYTTIQQITYLVYSDKETQIRNICNFIVDLSKRYDWTAEEVNDFIPTITNSSGDSDDSKFDFKYVHVISTIGPEPFDNENGRQAGAVNIRICSTVDDLQTLGKGKGMRA
jgi:hypothetical protein